MSLQQEFFDGIEEIFTELDDLVLCATYVRTIAATYIAGGQVSKDKQRFSVRYIEDKSSRTINGVSVDQFDKVFLIPAVDLNCKAPSTNDQVITADGASYNVDQVQSDPSLTNYLVGFKR